MPYQLIFAGIHHQELHSIFFQNLQLPLRGLPAGVYADLLRYVTETEDCLAALHVSKDVLAEFRSAVNTLNPENSLTLETDQQVQGFVNESSATANRLDKAMGRIREQLTVAESVAYAMGICLCASGVFARLVLSNSLLFSAPDEAGLQRRIYVLRLRQTGQVINNFLAFPDYAEAFRDEIPSKYTEDLRRIARLIADNPDIPDSTARAIEQIVDTQLKTIGYESIFVRLFADLGREYASDSAFQIDLLQLLASLLAENDDEFKNDTMFPFGVAPPWEGPKVFAGAREATAFLSSFKFTSELFRELTWNPLFSREDLAGTINDRLKQRIPESWAFGSQFKREGDPLQPTEFYGFFKGTPFIYRLVAKTVLRICEFQIHIASRTRNDPQSEAGGPLIYIPEGSRLLPPNDWGYQLSYIDSSRLFSPTHAAWARRARHTSGVSRHVLPGFDTNVGSSSRLPAAWDIDSHAVAAAKGIGRRPTEPRLGQADKTELYESGIRALRPNELYGDHLSAYLFDANHDYVSRPRDETANHRLYRDNVVSPAAEFFVDSYYQSVFLPSRLVPAALYGADSSDKTSAAVMRARHKRIPVSTARTVEEFIEIAERAGKSLPGKTLLYRGQTRHFKVKRTDRVREFFYGSPDVDELSLTTTASRADFPFESLLARFQLYLQGLLYRDIKLKIFANVTPEDSRHWYPFDNIYLSSVYRTWTEIYCESQWDVLATGLAQHYGIPTNGIDLTENLDVAIWFALNEIWSFNYHNRRCHWYKPIENWRDQTDQMPVIYLIATDRWLPRHLDQLQNKLPLPEALRPTRQSAHLHFGGWGLQSNTCAEDVVHAIFLAPGFRTREQLATADLFPSRKDDDFYDALLELKAKTAGGISSVKGYETIIEFLEPPSHIVQTSQKAAESVSGEASTAEPTSSDRVVGDKDSLGEKLFNAVNMGRFAEADQLIEAGAEVNFKGQKDHPQGGGTPLHWVALYGNVELVRKLIDRGANVNAVDNVGRTPLFPAAANGHVEVVKLLLAHGADTRAMKYLGWKLIPTTFRHPEIVKLLTEYGWQNEASLNEMPPRPRRLSKAKLTAIIRHSVLEWNAMRNATNPFTLDLSGANLTRADLIGVDLSGAILVGTSFVEANLLGANLQNANLSGANFEAATISKVNFFGALNLDQTSFVDVYWDEEPTWPEGFVFKRVDTWER